jgi:ubiquinone/menaquinone biosynthesis C-methylase UbiE
MRKKSKSVDYTNAKVRKEVLIRQRRGMWTPDQIAGFTRHFGLKPGMKLLDAGCGYGYSLRTFGPYCLPGGLLVGADIDMQLLATARQKAAKEGLARSSRFVTGNIYNLPFRKNTFDVSIAQVLLCHLSEPGKALDELIRVTRRGGCIAVFDNAVAGGGYGGWTNVRRPILKRQVFDHEMHLRSMRGRRKLGQGDFNVGCYMPSWMEKRGLKSVEARSNERVYWVAPPYKSVSQKTAMRNMRERLKEGAFDPRDPDYLRYIAQLRAGGVTDKTIRKIIERMRKYDAKYRKAVKNKTIAFAYAVGGFWCIWGFKP